MHRVSHEKSRKPWIVRKFNFVVKKKKEKKRSGGIVNIYIWKMIDVANKVPLNLFCARILTHEWKKRQNFPRKSLGTLKCVGTLLISQSINYQLIEISMMLISIEWRANLLYFWHPEEILCHFVTFAQIPFSM